MIGVSQGGTIYCQSLMTGDLQATLKGHLMIAHCLPTDSQVNSDHYSHQFGARDCILTDLDLSVLVSGIELRNGLQDASVTSPPSPVELLLEGSTDSCFYPPFCILLKDCFSTTSIAGITAGIRIVVFRLHSFTD